MHRVPQSPPIAKSFPVTFTGNPAGQIVPMLNIPHRLRLHLFVALLTTGIVAGCSEPDSIRVYSVNKTTQLAPSEPIGGNTGGRNPATPPVQKEPARMLAAMLNHADSSWFFKVLGNPTAVAGVESEFRDLVQQVVFPTADEPTLVFPEEWERKPGNRIRLATLEIPAEPKALELTVIRLPKQPELANVNRWRGQVGLPPITTDELADVERIKTKSGEALYVNLEGTAAVGGPRMPPFAPFANRGGSSGLMPGNSRPAGPPVAGPAPPGTDSDTASSEASKPFEFSVPDSWEPAKNDRFSKLAFSVQDGRVTATPMGAAALVMNINRWRGQVGLDSLEGEKVFDGATEIKSQSGVATYVRLFEEGDTDDRQAILGAILPITDEDGASSGAAWFLKFKGPAKLATDEEDNFKTFVESIQF